MMMMMMIMAMTTMMVKMRMIPFLCQIGEFLRVNV